MRAMNRMIAAAVMGTMIVGSAMAMPALEGLPKAATVNPKYDGAVGSYHYNHLTMSLSAVTSKSASGSWQECGGLRCNANGQVEVAITYALDQKPSLGTLSAIGAIVENDDTYFHQLWAWAPGSALSTIAALPGVTQISRPHYAQTSLATIVTGAAVIQANKVRLAGLDGTGIKVGVISDCDTNLPSSVIAGDLPSNVSNFVPQSGFQCTGDEGTAMLEIVHNIAPGAQLGFCGPQTPGDFLSCVNELGGQFKANIIVDDLAFPGMPMYQNPTGNLADALQQLTQANPNVRFVTSADNYAEDFYEANFNPVTFQTQSGNVTFHDFGATAGGQNNPGNQITIVAGDSLDAIIQWQTAWGSSPAYYGIAFFDDATGTFLASTPFGTSQLPAPSSAVSYSNNTGANQTIDIVVFENQSGGPANFKAFITCGGHNCQPPPALSSLQFTTPRGSIFGHASIPGYLTVAATSLDSTASNNFTVVEPFSSQGPVFLGFDPNGTPHAQSVPKPDVTAIDCVQTSGAGNFHQPFCGTSAAAPHVAAALALLMQGFTGNAVQALEQTAVQLDGTRPGPIGGWGRINVYEAAKALDTRPIATNGTRSVQQGTPVTGTLTATGSRPLTYVIVTQPMNGTVILPNASNPSFTYTPASSFVGTDSFVFQASDGLLTSQSATESINVTAPPASGGGGGGGAMNWLTLVAFLISAACSRRRVKRLV
jgi:hypothetical protein